MIARTLAQSVLPPTNPPWPPEWRLSRSTLTMQCNSSGWSSPERAAPFGIVSYDWSNAKAQWAAAKPMDCEERLLDQARMSKKAGAEHVFVYRNVVKALPWFATVREKLDDPAYSSWFLRFDKRAAPYSVPACAAENASKCSPYYHDQANSSIETGEVIAIAPSPSFDGRSKRPRCRRPHSRTPTAAARTACATAAASRAVSTSGTIATVRCCASGSCSSTPSAGRRRWATRRSTGWYRPRIERRTFTPRLARTFCRESERLAFDPRCTQFVDDYWCSDLVCKADPHVAGCPCGDPVQGPTEVDKHSQIDMGLSDEAIRDITVEWNMTMGAVQTEVLRRGGYTWSLMEGQQNANAMPRLLKRETCAAQLAAACTKGSDWQRHAILFGLTVTNATRMAQLQQDVAFFQLARGPYAWLGWGEWGMTWSDQREPNPQSPDSACAAC